VENSSGSQFGGGRGHFLGKGGGVRRAHPFPFASGKFWPYVNKSGVPEPSDVPAGSDSMRAHSSRNPFLGRPPGQIGLFDKADNTSFPRPRPPSGDRSYPGTRRLRLEPELLPKHAIHGCSKLRATMKFKECAKCHHIPFWAWRNPGEFSHCLNSLTLHSD
jgi:hypothetical protein